MNESERQKKIRDELVREKDQEKLRDQMGDGIMIEALVISYKNSDLIGKITMLASAAISLYILYIFSDWFWWIIRIGRW